MAVIDRGVYWSFVVWLVQVAVIAGFVLGVVPLHPVTLVLPLVGLLNARVDQAGLEGLGLTAPPRPRATLLLTAVFGVLSFGGRLIVVCWDGGSLQRLLLTGGTVGSLAMDLVVDVFIIALWEEIVNRGYVQNRLQKAWGFAGVIVATVLFAALHLPSAVLSPGYGLSAALLRLVQTGLLGFVFGYVFLRSGEVLTTIALHGLDNFALSVSLRLADLTAAQMLRHQMVLQLLWSVGQAAVVLMLCRAMFGNGKSKPLGA